MKKIFYILYGMLLMTGAFTITSCLSDDNDSDDYDGIKESNRPMNEEETEKTEENEDTLGVH